MMCICYWLMHGRALGYSIISPYTPMDDNKWCINGVLDVGGKGGA